MACCPKRLLTNALIVAYLAALGVGLALHALNLPGKASAAGYFVVWDMFCGWTGYETRVRYIGEGVSGQHYDLLAADSRSPRLHGSIHRAHYDFSGRHTPAIAACVAARTGHEPLARIYVVEENWSKHYNLSPRLFEQTYGRPHGEFPVHRHFRGLLAADGYVLQTQASWLAVQRQEAMLANPKLMTEVQRGRDVFTARTASAPR